MRKKIIAREILIFFAVLIFSGLFFTVLNIYNYSIERQIKMKIVGIEGYENTIDSLKNESVELLFDNSIYKFLKENELTKMEPNDFLNTYSKLDSSIVIYHFFKSNNLTDLSQEEFYEKYLNRVDAEKLIMLNEGIKIIERDLIAEDETMSKLKTNLLPIESIVNYSKTFLILVVILLYPLRFSLIAVRWALKNLN